MSQLSYNEEKNRQIGLRHIFWPNSYGLASEAIIGILALLVFNASELSNQFLEQGVNAGSPSSLLFHPLKQVLSNLDKYYTLQRVMLFGLWAIVGALIYVLVFWALQISFGVEHSVSFGVKLVRQDHNRGLLRWLASLHDFFLKALIIILGVGAVAMGAVVCFGIASQELANGLSKVFPANMGLMAISLLAAIISVRIIVVGLTLLSARFRGWYTT